MAMSQIGSNIGSRANDFGRTIRKWRLARGMGQKELGLLIGIGNDEICRYEKGERTPTWERAVELSAAMYPDDKAAQERFVNVVGYTLYRELKADDDVTAFADMLTRGNVPEEYKQAARTMVRSLVRLTNGYR